MKLERAYHGIVPVDFYGYTVFIPQEHNFIYASSDHLYSCAGKPISDDEQVKFGYEQGAYAMPFFIGFYQPEEGEEIAGLLFRIEELDGRLVAQEVVDD